MLAAAPMQQEQTQRPWPTTRYHSLLLHFKKSVTLGFDLNCLLLPTPWLHLLLLLLLCLSRRPCYVRCRTLWLLRCCLINDDRKIQQWRLIICIAAATHRPCLTACCCMPGKRVHGRWQQRVWGEDVDFHIVTSHVYICRKGRWVGSWARGEVGLADGGEEGAKVPI
jgi:hypothetical protein